MTLDDLHERFTSYISKIEGEMSVVTNHNYTVNIQENFEDVEFNFKVASAFNIIKYYRTIAIIFSEFGERELNLIPEILTRYFNKEEFKNLNLIIVDSLEPERRSAMKNILFTGRVFIECNKLKLDKKELYNKIEILNFNYYTLPLYFTIRCTNDYSKIEKSKMKTIFLCHDSMDKQLVQKVNSKLSLRLYNVWFDKFSIKPGDSIFEKINEGLNQCDNGLLFISKSFLNNQGWVRFELQSLINKQIYERKKIIIPIWIDINPDDLNELPWLRDKLAVRYSEDLDLMVREIEGALI